MMGTVLSGIAKKAIPDKAVQQNIKKMYRDIVLRADDIGGQNRLLGSYALAAFFIAMNRCDHLSAEENSDILEYGLSHSKIYKMVMGNSKHYFSEKNMESRRKWSK